MTEVLACMKSYSLDFLATLGTWLIESPVPFIFVVLCIVSFVFCILRRWFV